jgi:hypothetical protein
MSDNQVQIIKDHLKLVLQKKTPDLTITTRPDLTINNRSFDLARDTIICTTNDTLTIEDEEEPMMSEDEYDAYLHREPIDGGPSVADELLSNEFRKRFTP